MFRRELEKAEQQIKRSTVIVADYKQVTREEFSGCLLDDVKLRCSFSQICSQLMSRLERQQAAHREELDSLKVGMFPPVELFSHRCLCSVENVTARPPSPFLQEAVKACPRCRHAVETTGPPENPGATGHGENNGGPRQAEQRKDDQEQESVRAQIRDLEQELAQTKLQMVEAKCKIQVGHTASYHSNIIEPDVYTFKYR